MSMSMIRKVAQIDLEIDTSILEQFITTSDSVKVGAYCDKCKMHLDGFVDDPRDVETKRLSLLLSHHCGGSKPTTVNINDSVITGGLHL